MKTCSACNQPTNSTIYNNGSVICSDCHQEMKSNRVMKRKEVLPKWIRFFAWLHLMFLLTPLIFIVGIFGEASFSMFGLSSTGSSLQPIAIWNTFIATLAGVVAYGILWGKNWAIKLGIPYAYIAIATCVAAIIIRMKGGGFYIPLEPALLIPFIVSLKKRSDQWDNFDSENEEQISNQSIEPIATTPADSVDG